MAGRSMAAALAKLWFWAPSSRIPLCTLRFMVACIGNAQYCDVPVQATLAWGYIYALKQALAPLFPALCAYSLALLIAS